MTTRKATTVNPTILDAQIRAMLVHRASLASAGDLREPILAAASASGQVGGWRRWLGRVVAPAPAPVGRRLLVLALVLLLVGSVVAAAVVGTGIVRVPPGPPFGMAPLPSSTPVPSVPTATQMPSTRTASAFIRPFGYRIEPDSTLRPALGEPRREIIAWVDGVEAPLPETGSSNGPGYGGQRTDSGVDAGIIVASADQAWSHGPSDRYMLRTAPAELLDDLRDTSRIALGPDAAITLDGRPALSVEEVSAAGWNDIHVNGAITHLSQDYVAMNMPGRLIVLDIHDSTVFILIWARSAERLTAFMPSAQAFVDSIEFVAEP